MNKVVIDMINSMLKEAAKNNDKLLIRAMIDEWSNIKEIKQIIRKIIIWSYQNNDIDTLKLFINSLNKVDDIWLIDAINTTDNLKIIKIFIDAGCDLEIKDDGLWCQERTPLLTAIEKNKIQLVKLLLNSGCNMYCIDKYNHTALYTACIYNHIDIIDILVEHNYDINMKDKHGYTALYGAVIYDKIEATKRLMELGCTVDLILIPNLLIHPIDNKNNDMLILLLKYIGIDEKNIDLIVRNNKDAYKYAFKKRSKCGNILTTLVDWGCNLDENEYIQRYKHNIQQMEIDDLNEMNNKIKDEILLLSEEYNYDKIELEEDWEKIYVNKEMEISDLKHKNKILNKELVLVKEHIKYKPNGIGYIEAKARFETSALNQ